VHPSSSATFGVMMQGKSPVRLFRTQGSVEGASSNDLPYSDRTQGAARQITSCLGRDPVVHTFAAMCWQSVPDEQLRDALRTPADLEAWLHANRTQLPSPLPATTATELERIRTLRSALRQLFGAVSEGATPPAAALQVVNDFSAAVPRSHVSIGWRALPT
jgi:Putative stress-induced transcription regulator